jgi:magnesium transporter
MPVIKNNDVHIEQVSMFCGKGYVLSFHDHYHEDTYQVIHARLAKNASHMRNKGSDYLLYALLDLIIDSGFPVLELFGEQLESIEESLFDGGGKSALHAIHHIKREIILLRRALWPQREVINSILREETPFISVDTTPYFRDCYDHTIQVMELIESYRDMAASTMEVYLSTVGFRLNEVMRFLTIISTLFIPPTFLVGIYGMNFKPESSVWSMPELSWPFGYLMVWLVVILMMIAMCGFFKRKNWF